MGFFLPSIKWPSFGSTQAASNATEVLKGYLAVYVREIQKKWFMIPIAYLSQPHFQELLNVAEEEFGYDHPMDALTIPYGEDVL